MNTEYPHELIDELELLRKPAKERRKYVPVPEESARAVQEMSPEERAQWLHDHPIDALRLARAREKRARRQKRKDSARQASRLKDLEARVSELEGGWAAMTTPLCRCGLDPFKAPEQHAPSCPESLRGRAEEEARTALQAARADIERLRHANVEMVRQRDWLLHKLNESDCERAALQARIDAGIRAAMDVLEEREKPLT